MMNALLAGFVGLVLSAPVVAEPLLEGIVRFASGEPAAAVRVRVFDMSDLQRGAVAQATTNPAGYFALPLSALAGSALPEGFTLGANYPNPFNPSTIIPYQLAALSEVRLEVFNLLGQRVTTLVEGEQPAGFHAATWHATDATGRAVGAGVYIYRLAVGAASQTGRMVLLDGQAGVSAVRAGPVLPAASRDEARVYGLLVEGAGLVPYMDEAFRVEVGMAPVELVVSAGSYWAGKVTKACALCGFLGDAATDSTALVALYNATDGDNWKNNTNWLSDRPLGEWHGVTTNDDGRVTGLELYNNQLSGAIPPELGNLTNLTRLWLLNNQLSGAIPAELGNLTNLIQLDLGGNELSGAIPAELGNLTNLQYLLLPHNQLSGAIPAELGNLTNLIQLWLSHNQLSGAIPAELGNLTNLAALNLFLNELSGAIPAELGNLTNLQSLNLVGNQLKGCVPEGLWNVRDNDLSGLGLLPCGADEVAVAADRAALVALYNATDGDNWTNKTRWLSDRPLGEWYGVTTDDNGRVTKLNLYNNRLSGAIPAELGNLTNLTGLSLNGNQLSGAIPAELGNLTNLTGLSLNGNQLSGAIPAELGNLTNLTGLSLNGNQLSGAIPAELGNLTNLTGLSLNGNQLSGAIPPELGNLAKLQRLFLNQNQLSGCVPEGLRNVRDNDLSDLGLLPCGADEVAVAADKAALVALYNATDGDNWTNNTNWFSDRPLGEWHGVFTDDYERVTQLSLSWNQLSGSIPTELGNLTNLIELNLSSNQLSGSIPAELGNLTNLIELNLSSNQLSGSIPAELGNLTNLTGLYLLFNQLSGEIPTELGNLTNLTELYLSSNQLSGQIPPELGNLANLQFLILYGNELSGSIPPELGNLSNLTRLSLGSNQLSGCLPEGLGHVENHDLLTLGLLSCGADEGDVTTDRAALAALYEATDGDNWKDNTHWLSDRPLGEWHGVTTNADGRVTGLSLYGNELSGSIPPALSNLPYLQSLDLSQNQLSGSIPPALGNLANLQSLHLGSNQLSGSIPPALGNFPYLTHLYLYGNQLSGSIPPRIGQPHEPDTAVARRQPAKRFDPRRIGQLG